MTSRPVHSGKARDHAAIRWWVLLAFVAVVVLLGGASRHDVHSLVLLRPLAVLFAGYALLIGRKEELARLPIPFFLLLALAGLMALQLLPLPPGLWSELPGRQIFVRLGQDVGLADVWRPLTLTPARTWNALFSLSVPLAAFLLYAIQPAERQGKVVWLMVAIGAASIALGLLQSLNGPDSVLYWYAIHNIGKPLGFFSNRNHQALFLAAIMLFAAVAAVGLSSTDRSAPFKLMLLVSFCVLTIPFLLILGSRSGVVLGFVAIVIAPMLFSGSAPARAWLGKHRGRKGRKLPVPVALLAVAAFLGTAAAVAGAALWNSRDEGFTRLFETDSTQPARTEFLPYLLQIWHDYMPLGSGFGSFDAIFRRYEKVADLSIFYLNQAHNDWLQLGIEGGIPGLLILLAFLGWLVAKAVVTFRDRRQAPWREKTGMLAVVLLIGVGSAVDYPLRVPIMMMLMAFVISLLDRRQDVQVERSSAYASPQTKTLAGFGMATSSNEIAGDIDVQ